MESILELLSNLDHLDIKIWVEGDRLKFNAPKGALTPELRVEIKERKTEIIAFLSQKSYGKDDEDSYDVVICGGGLAGATLARQLKLNLPDISVIVLDRLARPLPEATFKVGESTVEVGAFYLAETLQLRDYLEQYHCHKLGLRFFFGNSRNSFEKRPEVGLSEFHLPHSYQIDRGKFENDLRRLNTENGVELLENCLVKDIKLAKGAQPFHRITYTKADNKSTQTLKARWIVDAMGRRRFLQKKLGLAQPNNKNFSAVWFRVDGRLDVSDFVSCMEEEWHNRVPNNNRYYSTNHLCGEGYWIWMIPLSTEHTSIGIVTNEEVHPFKKYHTYERAQMWLKENEPILSSHLEQTKPKDFKKMPRYSYSSGQVFSLNRWGCVGEAATFPDPFYSPGINMIGFGNSLITQMIALDLEDKLTQKKVEEANYFYLTQNDGLALTIHNCYSCFSSEMVMATKLIWDTLTGWALSGPMMFNSIFLDPLLSAKIQRVAGPFIPLSYRVQQLFLDWAAKSQGLLSFKFIDYLAIPFVRELRERNLKSNKTEQELIDDHISSLEILEELAQVIFLLALEDTMPEILSKLSSISWLNAWAISLDVSKWESDGLFRPKTKPRDLSRIRKEIRQVIQWNTGAKETVGAS